MAEKNNDKMEMDNKENDKMEIDNKKKFGYFHELSIQCGKDKWAEMIAKSISVGGNFNNNVTREITVTNDTINVKIEATKWKWLRVSIDSFYADVLLCLDAIKNFSNFSLSKEKTESN